MNISPSKQERAAGTSARGGGGSGGVSGQPRVGPSNTASQPASPPDPPLSTSFKILTGATLRFAKCVANRRALSCLPHTKRKIRFP